jgi:hypothetical protein
MMMCDTNLTPQISCWLNELYGNEVDVPTKNGEKSLIVHQRACRQSKTLGPIDTQKLE